MARARRLALPGELHYAVQRGHNRQAVFADDEDREAYLAMLRESAAQHGVAIHAYALLPSEVHLMVTPAAGSSLSRLMQSVGRRYVAAYNRRHDRAGTLWAGRFRAGLIDGASLGIEALVHVESLPVRAGFATSAADWRWSSARHHLGLLRDPLITEHPAYWAEGNTPFERELAHAHKLIDAPSPGTCAGFDGAAARARTFGSAAFTSRIALVSGVDMRPKRRGRPRTRSAAHP